MQAQEEHMEQEAYEKGKPIKTRSTSSKNQGIQKQIQKAQSTAEFPVIG